MQSGQESVNCWNSRRTHWIFRQKSLPQCLATHVKQCLCTVPPHPTLPQNLLESPLNTPLLFGFPFLSPRSTFLSPRPPITSTQTREMLELALAEMGKMHAQHVRTVFSSVVAAIEVRCIWSFMLASELAWLFWGVGATGAAYFELLGPQAFAVHHH